MAVVHQVRKMPFRMHEKKNIYLHKQVICAISNLDLEMEDFSLPNNLGDNEKTNSLFKLRSQTKPKPEFRKAHGLQQYELKIQCKFTAGTLLLRSILKEGDKHSAILYIQFSLQSESEAHCTS